MPRLAPILNDMQFDNNGRAAVGWRVFTWLAGSLTKRSTSVDPAGVANHENPIILNARGETPSPIYLDEGISYRLGLCPPGSDDPPGTIVRDFDVVHGVGDALTGAIVEWIESGITPTFLTSTRFSLPGDQASTFHVGRRLRFTAGVGTVYGEVSKSVFTTLTTIDVQMSLGGLDAGLSKVAFGINSALNSSDPLGSRELLSPHTPLTSFENLIVTTPTVSTITILADKVVVRNAIGQAAVLESITITLNIAASGVNGLDTGAEAVSTGYFGWVIWDGVTKAGVLSASNAAPALPTGYTHKGLVCAVFNDAAGNFVSTDLRGRFVSIKPVTVLSLGSATAITGVSLSDAIPPNVWRVLLNCFISGLSATEVLAYIYSDVAGLIQVQSIGNVNSTAPSTVRGAALVPLRTSQTLWYKVTDVNADLTIDVVGYVW